MPRNSKEIKKRANFLYEELSKISINLEIDIKAFNEIDNILDSLELFREIVEKQEEEVTNLITKYEDKNEATEMKSQTEKKLILKFLNDNSEHQKQLQATIKGYIDQNCNDSKKEFCSKLNQFTV